VFVVGLTSPLPIPHRAIFDFSLRLKMVSVNSRRLCIFLPISRRSFWFALGDFRFENCASLQLNVLAFLNQPDRAARD